MRKGSLKLLFLWVILIATDASIVFGDADGRRPNIVFIFSDDHAPHAIGAYDGWLKSINPTPNIDRLAS
ncbi:MAG: acetylglucosamine-6-sulfatase, partial [Lacipirellulaceae bacterium]